MNIASHTKPTVQRMELSLVLNVDTDGEVKILLLKVYVVVAVPIVERNLKYLIPERGFSRIVHISKLLQDGRTIKCYAILWCM